MRAPTMTFIMDMVFGCRRLPQRQHFAFAAPQLVLRIVVVSTIAGGMHHLPVRATSHLKTYVITQSRAVELQQDHALCTRSGPAL